MLWKIKVTNFCTQNFLSFLFYWPTPNFDDFFFQFQFHFIHFGIPHPQFLSAFLYQCDVSHIVYYDGRFIHLLFFFFLLFQSNHLHLVLLAPAEVFDRLTNGIDRIVFVKRWKTLGDAFYSMWIIWEHLNVQIYNCKTTMKQNKMIERRWFAHRNTVKVFLGN